MTVETDGTAVVYFGISTTVARPARPAGDRAGRADARRGRRTGLRAQRRGAGYSITVQDSLDL